jgi:hypothetical protein
VSCWNVKRHRSSLSTTAPMTNTANADTVRAKRRLSTSTSRFPSAALASYLMSRRQRSLTPVRSRPTTLGRRPSVTKSRKSWIVLAFSNHGSDNDTVRRLPGLVTLETSRNGALLVSVAPHVPR